MSRARDHFALVLVGVVVAFGWIGMAAKVIPGGETPNVIQERVLACSAERSRAAGLSGFVPSEKPQSIATGSFYDAEGKPVTVADFVGQGLLLNFWATWCAPCVAEMPALDRLDATLKDRGVRVIPISEDRIPRETSPPFYEKLSLTSLGMYADERMAFAREASVAGLPTSILVSPEGIEMGVVLGAAEWDEPAIADFLERCLAPAGR